MPILFDEKAQTLTLHTDHTSYQMKVMHKGILVHTYYGPRAEGDMSYAIQYRDRGFSGNPFTAGMDRTVSCDTLPLEYPCEGNGDYRRTAFSVRDSRGVSGCDLRYVSHRVLPGMFSLNGLPAVYAGETEAQTLSVLLRDERLSLDVELLYGVLPALDCVARTVIVTNRGSEPVTLQACASMSLDFLHGSFDSIVFYGRHAEERFPEREPVGHAERVIGSRRGHTSHHANPFIVLCDRDATEEHGMCIGTALLWSGSFCCSASMDSLDQTRLMMGIQEERFDYELEPGESFTAPEAVTVMSLEGLTGMSLGLHELAQEHIIRSDWRDVPRPILINNWEATYMKFTGEKIVGIARQAAELGIDMMVLDDGWFGRRNDDHDGLGDWQVNEAKLGCSMTELVDKIHGMGMKFGLWIEPEMVNMASDLFRDHPDWAFRIPGKDPVRSRDQLVLDFSRPEVVDYIFGQISRLLSCGGIDYIKMDMNRSLCDVCTAAEDRQSQGKVLYRYVLGVYRFIRRLLEEHPGLLIEGCSGGGGRFDLGMLQYTPQIWCSDNTDAIDRLKIQYGTSFCYPPSCMGAHVSFAPNHQTGRVTPISVRGAVAMAGTFGYELDLGLLSKEDKEEIRAQVKAFRGYQKLVRFGRYYRLTDNMKDPEKAAWIFVSRDRSEALLTWVTLSCHDNDMIQYVCCRGLDPEARYRDETSGQILSGAALMHQGLPIPRHYGNYTACQIHLLKV